LYNEDRDFDEQIQLPSLNFNDYGNVLEYLKRPESERDKVIVRIRDTGVKLESDFD
jgi:hypothetical protein